MARLIESGLPLGLRFYDELTKQNRYKFSSSKVIHYEYQYTDNCTIPPFQIIRNLDASETKELSIVCVDTGETTDLIALFPAIANDIYINTWGAYDYISYYASHDCMNLPIDQKALYYAIFSDGVNSWYSELFWIDPDLEDMDSYYRIWREESQKRKVDINDLRIFE